MNAFAQQVAERDIATADLIIQPRYEDYDRNVISGYGTRTTIAVTLRDVQKQLGMKEGFDVGLEMSGNPQAFKDMLAKYTAAQRPKATVTGDDKALFQWRVV